MKKIIFGIIAMVLFSLNGFSQTRTAAPVEQRIHIEFGRKSMDCAGFGICILRIELEVEDIIAIVSAFFDRDGRLQIKMPAKYYDANKSKFVNNVVTIDEDFIVPSSETSKLGKSSNYTIKKGKYPIVLNTSTNTYNCTF